MLYMYTKDTKDTSACYDACATNWPPLLADKIDAKDGVDAKLIGYTKRTDGKMQVTYNGMPLYYWVKDAKARRYHRSECGWCLVRARTPMAK